MKKMKQVLALMGAFIIMCTGPLSAFAEGESFGTPTDLVLPVTTSEQLDLVEPQVEPIVQQEEAALAPATETTEPEKPTEVETKGLEEGLSSEVESEASEEVQTESSTEITAPVEEEPTKVETEELEEGVSSEVESEAPEMEQTESSIETTDPVEEEPTEVASEDEPQQPLEIVDALSADMSSMLPAADSEEPAMTDYVNYKVVYHYRLNGIEVGSISIETCMAAAGSTVSVTQYATTTATYEGKEYGFTSADPVTKMLWQTDSGFTFNLYYDRTEAVEMNVTILYWDGTNQVGDITASVDANVTSVDRSTVQAGLPAGYELSSNASSFGISNGGTVSVTVEPKKQEVVVTYWSGTNQVGHSTLSVDANVTSVDRSTVQAGLPAGYELSSDASSFGISNGGTVSVTVEPKKQEVVVTYWSGTNQVGHFTASVEANATSVSYATVLDGLPEGYELSPATQLFVINDGKVAAVVKKKAPEMQTIEVIFYDFQQSETAGTVKLDIPAEQTSLTWQEIEPYMPATYMLETQQNTFGIVGGYVNVPVIAREQWRDIVINVCRVDEGTDQWMFNASVPFGQQSLSFQEVRRYINSDFELAVMTQTTFPIEIDGNGIGWVAVEVVKKAPAMQTVKLQYCLGTTAIVYTKDLELDATESDVPATTILQYVPDGFKLDDSAGQNYSIRGGTVNVFVKAEEEPVYTIHVSFRDDDTWAPIGSGLITSDGTNTVSVPNEHDGRKIAAWHWNNGGGALVADFSYATLEAFVGGNWTTDNQAYLDFVAEYEAAEPNLPVATDINDVYVTVTCACHGVTTIKADVSHCRIEPVDKYTARFIIDEDPTAYVPNHKAQWTNNMVELIYDEGEGKWHAVGTGLTISAETEEPIYTIHVEFKGVATNNGDVTSDNPSKTLNVFPVTAPEGKKFAGWSLAGNMSIYTGAFNFESLSKLVGDNWSAEKNESSLTFEAVFVPETEPVYTIHVMFEGVATNNGDVTSDNPGKTLNVFPVTAPEGKKFAGWSLAGNMSIYTGAFNFESLSKLVGDNWSADRNESSLTFEAVFVPETEPVYTIHVEFKGVATNNGDVTSDNPSKTLNVFPVTAPEGKKFAGWSLAGNMSIYTGAFNFESLSKLVGDNWSADTQESWLTFTPKFEKETVNQTILLNYFDEKAYKQIAEVEIVVSGDAIQVDAAVALAFMPAGYVLDAATVQPDYMIRGGYVYIPVCPKTYTVIYTDGVDNYVAFENQVYTGLAEGAATPAFKGTPKLAGYVFAGWYPKVEKTVTEDVTYTATWRRLASSSTGNRPSSTGNTSYGKPANNSDVPKTADPLYPMQIFFLLGSAIFLTFAAFTGVKCRKLRENA